MFRPNFLFFYFLTLTFDKILFSVAALEGVFWAISGYCGIGPTNSCLECGSGVQFEDILEVQNETLASIRERELNLGYFCVTSWI